MLSDCQMRAEGFFPGARVALVEDGRRRVLPRLIEAALADLAGAATAQVIVTAGQAGRKIRAEKALRGASEKLCGWHYTTICPTGQRSRGSCPLGWVLRGLIVTRMDAVTGKTVRTLDPAIFDRHRKAGLYMRFAGGRPTMKDVEGFAPRDRQKARGWTASGSCGATARRPRSPNASQGF